MAKTPPTTTTLPIRSSITGLPSDLRSVSRDDDDEDHDAEATSLHSLTATGYTEVPPVSETTASSASVSDLANGESSVSSPSLYLHTHAESSEPSVKATVTGHKAGPIEHSPLRRHNSTPSAPNTRPVLRDRQMNLPGGSSSSPSRKRKAPTLAGLSTKATNPSVLVQPSMTTLDLSSDHRSPDEIKDKNAECSHSYFLLATRDASVPLFSEAKLSSNSSSNLATGESSPTIAKLLSGSHEAPPHSSHLSVLTGNDAPIAPSPPHDHAPTLSASNAPRSVLQNRRINLSGGSSSSRSLKSKATPLPSLASKAKSPPIRHLTQPSAKKLKVDRIPEPLVHLERRQATDILVFILMKHQAGLMKELLWLWFTELSPLGLRGQFDEILEKEEFILLKTRGPDAAKRQVSSIVCISYDASLDAQHDKRIARIDRLPLRRDGRTAMPSSLTHDDEFF